MVSCLFDILLSNDIDFLSAYPVNLPTVFQKTSQGISRDGFSITFNDDNTSLMESITTASHRLKDDNIIICAQFYSQHIIIDLHAMDENGKKI